MAAQQPYAGLREPDVASITASGVYYICYAYIDHEAGNVMARMFVEQPHGQRVLVNTWVVRDGTSGEMFCTRIIATDDIFQIFWTSSTAGNTINRSYLDISAGLTGNAWTSAGSIAVHADLLFDVWPAGSGDDIFIAFKNATPLVEIRRCNSLANLLADWTTLLADSCDNCVTIWGDVTLNKVMAAYQKGGTTQMWYSYGDAAGSAPSLTQAFTDARVTDLRYSAVGIANMDGTGLAIVAEARDESYSAADVYKAQGRMIIYRKVTLSSGAKTGNEHWCYNLSLQSKPFAYASDDTDGVDPRVYCFVGFHSDRENNNWEQSYYFCVDLDAEEWTETTGTVRPMPVWNGTLGNADARVHDLIADNNDTTITFKLSNHLSNAVRGPQFGPGLKTRTVALTTWGRMTTVNRPSTVEAAVSLTNIQLEPITAKVSGYVFHMEEPWLTHRDSTDPAMPSANHKFAYPWTQNKPVNYGRGTLFGGGTPKIYDGDMLTEIGFCWRPELLNLSTSGSSPVPAGTYWYTVIAEWRDTQGKLHRSGPSTPTQITLASAKLITLTARCVNLSMKESHHYTDHPRIDIVPYRTKNGGATFYRCFGGTTAGYTHEDTPSNDPASPFITIADGNLDEELADNDILSWQFLNAAWTPLEPVQPPAGPVNAVYRNRYWQGGGEVAGELWYSLQTLPEPGGADVTAPEFNPANTFRINTGDEQITALESMDQFLVVFTSRSIYIVTGEPNDDTGFGSSLDYMRISPSVGCIEPRSTVLTPEGVFFQSMKGVYLLTRTRELRYVGAQVEDIIANAGNVRAVTAMEDRNEIRYVLNEAPEASARVLCFNYHTGQWSRFVWDDTIVATANLSTYNDGLAWRGRDGEVVHVVLAGAGLLIERAAGATAYKDSDKGGTAPVVMDIQTGWIRPTPEMGRWVRFRSAIVQFDKPQSSQVFFTLDYEIDGSWDATLTETKAAASPAPKAVRIPFGVQKCSGVRIRIYENGAVAETENIKIVSLTIEVGIRSGHKRVPDSAIIT